jgi:hypothetical protein
MRPFPLSFRVSLFAVGFGLGLFHYKPQSTQRPIILEIYLSKQDFQDALNPLSPLKCGPDTPLQTASVRYW